MSNPAGRHETGGGVRAQRADARANRARILDVAEEVFGQGGESASTEEVARLAGVGIATVFRHFPTKAALLGAVLTRRFDRLREQAEALLNAADPGPAFVGFFRYLVADAPAKIGLAEALLDAGGDDSEAAQASTELRRAFGALLRRAQQAGVIRDDVELPEVYALLVGISRAAAHEHLDEEVTARMLTIVFDGLAPRPNRARLSTPKRGRVPEPAAPQRPGRPGSSPGPPRLSAGTRTRPRSGRRRTGPG
jgi:AcrR family transcriptional regulator